MNSTTTPQNIFPQWMRGFLLATTAYNILWGVLIGWFPETFFHWVTESQNTPPGIIVWQGRAVLLLAGVYLAGAIHPGKLWYLIFLGAFTKLAGGLWFYFHILNQEVGDKALFHLIMNDGVWIPFLTWIGFKALAYRKMQQGAIQ